MENFKKTLIMCDDNWYENITIGKIHYDPKVGRDSKNIALTFGFTDTGEFYRNHFELIVPKYWGSPYYFGDALRRAVHKAIGFTDNGDIFKLTDDIGYRYVAMDENETIFAISGYACKYKN